MVEVVLDPLFEKKFSKVKDNSLKIRIEKQIDRIIDNPKVGKPMMHERKGTREVYISPFRLSYAYLKEKSIIILLDLYHKDTQ
ncbi:MAG: type II toxin-antitoxin system RelE/ParE family toxin [Candidatus Woesearchaeota archaeon]|nr:MAG: type II toxin-antitoxin system RelE/ParE family toxin [Candidatus Woesearchaeota archaeon]